MEISLCVITFNEERNIDRLLQSAYDVVDEIIIVDSFSTDGTSKICQKYPEIKFICNKFEDYATQKNFAVSLATKDYVLVLDADEQLSDLLKKEISKIKKSATSDAYSFNRMTNYCGMRWIKHCGWYPDVAIRLIKREKAVFKGAFVHEGVVLSPEDTIVHLRGDLLHYSYYTVEEHIERVNKYSTLGARKYLARHKTAGFCKILFSPVWTFFRMYVLRLGFLDGRAGFYVCKITAFETFLKCIKLKELNYKK
ncbi:MAG: glycosyltransferase family 2 protein [Bacteroidales bacterium]|nr:glycosyltransferase family 2 protein [Bacteroidales bacterium]